MVLRLLHRPRRRSAGDSLEGSNIRPEDRLCYLNMGKRRASSSTPSNGDVPFKARGSSTKAQSQIQSSQKKIIICSCIVVAIATTVYEFRSFISSGLDSLLDTTSESSRNNNRNKDYIDTGGWRVADELTAKNYDTSICTIERRRADQISNSEFENVYRFKKPVILTFPNGAAGWTVPYKWTLTSLKREYGEWSVLSGNAREIVRRGGSGYTFSSFTEYVDKLMTSQDSVGEPYYIFDREFYNDSDLPSTVRPPSYLRIKDGIDDSIFFLGCSGSGVSFHKHADAWNGVVFGRKRWFLYPTEKTPPGGVYPGFTQTEWFHHVYPQLNKEEKPIECIQEPGEILYLPEGFYHGTINLGDTVAIGIQKKEASTEIESLFYEDHKVSVDLQKAGNNQDERRKAFNRKKEIFEELLEKIPGNSEINMKAGQMYKQYGDQEKARMFTARAIEIDPYFVVAMLNLAGMYAQLGDVAEAETLYQRSMALSPSLWDNYAQYGDFLLNNNRAKEAVVLFKKGTELEPETVAFWEHLKFAQEKIGDVKGARQTQDVIDKLREQKP